MPIVQNQNAALLKEEISACCQQGFYYDWCTATTSNTTTTEYIPNNQNLYKSCLLSQHWGQLNIYRIFDHFVFQFRKKFQTI